MTSRVALAAVVVLLSGCAGSKEEAAKEPERAAAATPSDAGAGEMRSTGGAGMAATSTTTRPTDAAAPGAGLPAGWEIAPTGTFSAKQEGGQVTITAKGENPTAGHEMKLMQSMLRIWPPQYVLIRKRPTGMAAQVVTPFEVTASFKAAEPVKTVIVRDGAGRHEVTVGQ